jgi:hypothetical protein
MAHTSEHMIRLVTVITFIALQLAAAAASHANSVAGRVMFASGPNSVERDGPTVGLIKGSFVFEGDTVLTGERGRLQLLMVDGQRIAIRPNTVFSIQDYELPEYTTDPIAVASGDGKVTLRLMKGAFRAISGEIGKSYVRANYQVIAPVATMGIRGTDYSVRWCDGDCGDEGPTPEDGLYIGVNVGGVWAQNAEGEIDVDRNEYAYIAAADSDPVFLLEPPAVLNPSRHNGEEQEDEKDNRSETSDDGSTEERPAGPDAAGNRLAEETAPTSEVEADDATEAVSEDPPEQEVTARNAELGVELSLEDGTIQDDLEDLDNNPNDDRDGDPDDGNAGGGNDDNGGNGGNPNDGNDGNPGDGNAGGGNDDDDDDTVGFRDPYQSADNDDDFDSIGGNRNDFRDGVLDGNAGGGNGVGSAYNAAVSLQDYGTAQAPAEVFDDLGSEGSDGVTGLKWGRWDSGFRNAPEAAHYVSDTQADRAVTLPTSGTLDYSLSGGTNPTDNHGNTGSLDSGVLSADFTNQTVTNELNITIGGDTWTATGAGSIDSGAPVFGGSYDVTRGSGGTGTGNFSGFFGGNPIDTGRFTGAPSGAGVGYQLNSGDTTVQGAAGFRANP